MEPVNSLVHRLAECLPDLLANQPVILAYLYGSAAQGNATPLSDVDLALVVNPHAFGSLSRLDLELEVEVELELACGVEHSDVRVVNDAPIPLRGVVVSEGILVFSRDEKARVEFETETRQAYTDFQPLARQRHQEFLAALERELDGEPEQS